MHRVSENKHAEFEVITLSNRNRFSTFCHHGLINKFAVESLLKIPLNVNSVSTVPRETLLFKFERKVKQTTM